MDKRRINVRAIIWLNGKLLAVKHRRGDAESPYYATLGGGLDPKESLPDGIKRELLEETGVHARIGKLLFMQQFASEREGYDEELELFYHIENPEDFLSIDLAATTHGAEELARCEFVDPSSVHILPSFLKKVDIAAAIVAPSAELFVEL